MTNLTYSKFHRSLLHNNGAHSGVKRRHMTQSFSNSPMRKRARPSNSDLEPLTHPFVAGHGIDYSYCIPPAPPAPPVELLPPLYTIDTNDARPNLALNITSPDAPT